MSFGSSPVVGLDVGTSAVRAAMVRSGRGGYALSSFGQIPLTPETVIDGELRDGGALTDAVSRLWKRSKIRSKKAVIGIANQRVVVRQVDLPYLDEKDLRASIRFQAADHVPMPIDEAEVDFHILHDYTNEDGEHLMRVLLVAAASDMVSAYVDAVQEAGIEVTGVDLAPFAVARAVSRAARGEEGIAGAEAIIDVGAGVTNIVVHVGGEPRFVRILLVGGDDVTAALARELDVSFEQAEAAKIDLGRGVGLPNAARVLSREVDALVEEIRGSIDYYVSREEGEPIGSLIVTGGGSLAHGLVPKLEHSLRMHVTLATPLRDINVKTRWKEEQVAQIEPVAAASIGLAIGAIAR